MHRRTADLRGIRSLSSCSKNMYLTERLLHALDEISRQILLRSPASGSYSGERDLDEFGVWRKVEADAKGGV